MPWGSVSDFDTYTGFCCNKKVDKHCPTLPFDGPGCVNNVLINALKKLMQCINALKKLTLRQL